MCTNATLGDSNPDTATGHEGDVSALCFRAFRPPLGLKELLTSAVWCRAGPTVGPNGRDAVLADDLWAAHWGGDQRPTGPIRRGLDVDGAAQVFMAGALILYVLYSRCLLTCPSATQSVIPGLGNERETMLDRIRSTGGRSVPNENGARRDGYAPLRDPDQDRGL